MDPITRWSPHQAEKHPFITGERFTGRWNVSRGIRRLDLPVDQLNLVARHLVQEREPDRALERYYRLEINSLEEVRWTDRLSGE